MRPSILAAAALVSISLLTGCGRNDPETPPAPVDVAPAPPPTVDPSPAVDASPVPAAPVATGPAKEPAPPSPVVDGMYVVYHCNDGTEPRVTFSGNLVKVELTVTTEPVVLSARASATDMSDTYSDDALTLHRDGLGITLDFGGGKTTRCTESQASA